MCAASLMVIGCSKDDGDSSQPAVEEKGRSEICVKTNVSNMQSRATTIDNNTALRSYDLKIDAYYNGTETAYLSSRKLHYTGGDPDWVFWGGSAQLHYYWPIEGSVYTDVVPNINVSSLDFVGYCPYTTPSYITTGPTYNHSTGVTFTATLPTTEIDDVDYMTLENQASLQEYLVAVLDEQTIATQEASGGVPLTFKHPFALIKFVITAASGTHVQINNIRIGGLYTVATCTYNGTTMSWGSYDDETKATMTIAQTLKIGGTTEGTPFMVIPNNYGSKTLNVNATWDDWSNPVTLDVSADVTFNWEPGNIYTYNLTLEKYALKVDILKFTEQW